MTIGNITLDRRVPVVTDAGPGKVGTLYTKVWKGDDYPASFPPGGQHGTPRAPKRARVDEHPYTCTWNSILDGVYQYSDNYGRTWYTCTGSNNWGGMGATLPWDSKDDLVLLGKLREKVAGSSFNLGTFLAEAGPALSLIGNAATRIGKAYRAARRRQFSLAADILVGPGKTRRKRGANNWLELQYGWAPLLQDAYDGAVFLAHLSAYPVQEVVRVRRLVEGSVHWGAYWIKPEKSYAFTSTSIKAILREKDVIALVGLKDPASIAWETLPYSFVLDWFIPIGNYLQARGLSQALAGTFVVSKLQKWRGEGAIPDPKVVPYYSVRGGLTVCSGGSLTRTVSSSLAIPLPSVKPLMQAASWRHCANAVALVISAKYI